MHTRFAGLLLVLFGVLLGGCASGPKANGFQPEIADQAKSVIYIFREARTLGGRPVGIYVNQQFVGELGPGQYLARVVDPGEYLVRAEDGGSAVRQVQINAGDAAYFRVQAGRFGRSVTVDLPETAQARRLIARTVRAPS